jgi:putative transposase
LVYHVLNRGVGGRKLFTKERDYLAFEKVMRESLERTPTRLLAWCLMPTHWHLLIWPKEDGELTAFVRWLTHTHVQRWHAHRHSAGTGHVYQGRYKSFPIQQDEHFLTVCRYVERNALRARLVERAEQWRWGSAWVRRYGGRDQLAMLSESPVSLTAEWTEYVNQQQTASELAAAQQAVRRSSPYGSVVWQRRTAARLGLEWSLRPRGRPPVLPAKNQTTKNDPRPL